jgi:hypothetical protein
MKLAILTTALFLTPFAIVAQQPHDDMAAKPPQTGDAMPMKAPVSPSKSLNITFEGRTTVLTVEDLLKLPQVTVHVHNEHRNADEDYTGPLVSDVLAKAGLVSNRETQPLILHSTVVATGTDGYFVLYSLAELEPSFTTGQSIIAVMKNNGLPNTEGGVIQIINANAAKPARWIHGLTQLNIMSLQANK